MSSSDLKSQFIVTPDLKSPLMKTLDWSIETLGRECNSTGLCIHFNKTRVGNMTDGSIPGCREEQTLYLIVNCPWFLYELFF